MIRRAVLSASLALMVFSPSLQCAEGEHASSGSTPAIGGDGETGGEAATERTLSVEEVLSLAQMLLNQGQVDEAEKIYRLLLSSPVEGIRIEAAFQLGLILVSRERFREAVLYFIAILNQKPDLPRVRLELARAYFLDKNYADATFQFELVKGGKLPPEVIANVDVFLDLIRRQKNWTLDFAMNPVFDSNISQVSGAKEECIDIWGMTLCRPLEEKTSGIGLYLNVNADYFKRFSQDWGLRTSLGLNGLEYKGRRYDDTSAYVAIGPRYLWASGEASLQPTFRQRWYAGKQYREEYGLRVDGRQIWNYLILDANASYTTYHYNNAYLNDILRGQAWGLRLQPRYILNDRTFVQAGLEFMRDKTRNLAYASNNWSYSLGAYRVLPYGFSLYLEGSLTEARYRAPQWFVTKDNRLDETKRQDDILGLSVSLSSNRLEKYNLTPILRFSHTKRASNIWSREYERNRLDFLLNLRI